MGTEYARWDKRQRDEEPWESRTVKLGALEIPCRIGWLQGSIDQVLQLCQVWVRVIELCATHELPLVLGMNGLGHLGRESMYSAPTRCYYEVTSATRATHLEGSRSCECGCRAAHCECH